MRRYIDHHLSIDFGAHEVFLSDQKLVLTRKEYELFAMLVRNSGDVVRRERLMLDVWGYSQEIRTRTLDVHIRHLRKKLGQFGDQYIETIFGVGYRFQPFRISSGEPLLLLPATA